MEKNLTTGSAGRQLIGFSLPYLLSYLLQTLYGMADLFIIGQYEGVAGTTAVAVGSQVMHMLTVMIVGLAMGTTVSIARAIGADDRPQAAAATGNTVTLDQVTATGDYFAMNSKNLTVTGLTLFGNYSFDGVENVTVSHSRLLSKDAFWNSRNVTVTDSFISGEYLGWNAENLTLIRCTVESLQGFCYIDRLTLQNCKLINTTLAFEYSTVDADITGAVDSVLNPAGGTIRADHIGQLTIDRDRVDPTKTTVIVREDA